MQPNGTHKTTASGAQQPPQTGYIFKRPDGTTRGPVTLDALGMLAEDGGIFGDTTIMDVATGKSFRAVDHPYLKNRLKLRFTPYHEQQQARSKAQAAHPDSDVAALAQEAHDRRQSQVEVWGIALGIGAGLFAALVLSDWYWREVIGSWWFLCFAVGQFAKSRGHRTTQAMLFAVWFSPIAGFFWVMAQPMNEDVLERRRVRSGRAKRCVRCRELIKPDAIGCKHCGADQEVAVAA